MVKKDAENLGTSKRGNKAVAGSTEAEKIIESARTSNDGTRESIPAEKVSIKEKMSQKKVLEELEKLYAPENFRGIVRAPADLMAMVSGRNLWKLSDNEIDTLSVNGSITARYFLATDPKWLALSMFSMALLTIYGTRAALHYKEIQEEKLKAAKKPAAQPPLQ